MYHFTWFSELTGITHLLGTIGVSEEDSIAVMSAWFVCAMLIVFALLGRRGLRAAQAKGGTLQYVPDTGISARNVWEIFTEALLNLFAGVIGDKEARRFFWLFGTLFIYIMVSNMLGLIPGFLPPTENVSNNFAMALVVFVVFNGVGFARHGVGYIKHMAGPVWWLSWMILPIELIGVLFRPVSLSLRLMGNIFGDHTVFGIMSSLVPWWLPIPSIFLGLGLFVAFLQAFVFTLLSVIYVALSVAHEADH